MEHTLMLREGSKCLLLLLVIGTIFSACTELNDNKYVERPAKQIYKEALNLLEKEEYKISAKTFEEVEQQHPYSILATKAQLMAAYAYYSGNRYDEAVIAIDRFIQFHPGHQDVPYAYYLKGLCYYEQIVDITRDQKITELANSILHAIVTKFPDSMYSGDARLKLDLTYDYLAGQEMEIGRFYMKQLQYLAAVNRFRRVVIHYRKTAHIPEALYRLVEGYIALGLYEEANQAVTILGYNFPLSWWYGNTTRLMKDNAVFSTKSQ